MNYSSAIFWICITSMLTLCESERDLYSKKCKRDCNTEHGSFSCWKNTTDGFSYGLSTTMIDYCRTIIELRQMYNDTRSWYDTSRDILVEQVNKFKVLKPKARQLSKETIKQIAISLLDKCFNASQPILSSELSCPSCSNKQNKLMKKWRLISIIFISTGFLFFVLIILLYAIRVKHTRRSYESIS